MSQLNNVSVTGNSGYFEINKAYQDDNSPLKVDLIYGTYKSEDGSQYLLPVVKNAERMVIEETLDHSYLPPTGVDDFSELATTLLLGDIAQQWKEGTIFGVQTIGGAGALKVGAEFLAKHVKCKTFYYSNPSWEMHEPIFLRSGFQKGFQYRYINEKTKSLDAEGFFEDISNVESGSVIILHVCGHNPTGVDLTKEQWKAIAEIVRERNIIPFFDIAYQGLASGDLEEDVWVLRYFLREGIAFVCAQSFSKTFTMYNERVGNLIFSLKSADNVESVKCHVSRIVRCTYSNPPHHGAQTVRKILANPELFNEWSKTFKVMSDRIRDIRTTFRKSLEEIGAPGIWNHITDQTGLFIFLNLTESQVKYIRHYHHVYLVTHGRINVTGMNKNNIKYVAEALNDTLRNCK